MYIQNFNNLSLRDMKLLAFRIASKIDQYNIILLNGGLGSGKSYLASSIINSFYYLNNIVNQDIDYSRITNIDSFKGVFNVTSPTYNILKIYDIKNRTSNELFEYILHNNKLFNISSDVNLDKIMDSNISIYHYDLYRLKSEDEIFELNIEEAFNNITIIEWPDIINNMNMDKSKIININIEIPEKTNEDIMDLRNVNITSSFNL
ncbi:MAG TPA: tRNA (adenosine(37)-N6)-threonylcarbamoyltransferase complex ATPase subunit type 1 TsaE [Candidatus Megaira endosymbiont of Hartmannula sinica]|nr:tRNA (adenosine(37)-N6)-threonylcarbamoyltransferase complex ATPase subunit type 1 TsaE [Candidatus Megaera endosymbiont of Hartmannula sinica]